MPGLDAKERNRIGAFRIGIALLGAAAGYGFLYLCFRSKGQLIRDPENAQHIGLLIFALIASIGEFYSRRKLRNLGFFPKNRQIPWTY